MPRGLVTRSARVTGQFAGQLPDHPVTALDNPAGGRVYLRIFFEYVQRLWDQPLRGDFAAVPCQPRFAPFRGAFVNPIGLGLRGVMFPQLHPGVRAVSIGFEGMEWRALICSGHDRTGRKVDTDADHIFRAGAFSEDGLCGRFQRRQPVRRILQRPVGGKRHGAVWQSLVDHAIGVWLDGCGDDFTGRHVYEHGACGLRAEIESQCELTHLLLSLCQDDIMLSGRSRVWRLCRGPRPSLGMPVPCPRKSISWSPVPRMGIPASPAS